MNISEDKYFEWKETLDGENNIVRFVRLAVVIFTKVLDKELNDSVSDNFLRKCYIGNVLTTKSILRSILHIYTGNEGEGVEENIVRALSVLHKVRTHLATRLLEREHKHEHEHDLSYARRFRNLDVDLSRCLNHIKSCEFYSSQYQFEKYDDGEMTLRARFSLLFRQIHADGYSKNDFINNIDAYLHPNPLKRNDIRGYRADQSSRCR